MESLRGEPNLPMQALQWPGSLGTHLLPARQHHCSVVTVLPPWEQSPTSPKPQVLAKNSFLHSWEPWEGNPRLHRQGEGRRRERAPLFDSSPWCWLAQWRSLGWGMSSFHGPSVTNSTTLNHIFQSNIVSITTQRWGEHLLAWRSAPHLGSPKPHG